MIVQKNFLMKLRDFGLNSYEAKLWVALLSRGVSTAGELSDIANVPRSRTYDVLESLEKKGFIIVKIGKPIKYLAVPPEEVIDRVKKKVVEDMEEKTKMLNEVKTSSVLSELNTLFKGGSEFVEATDKCGAIKGKSHIDNQIETLVKNAEKRVLLHTTSSELPKDVERLMDVFRKISGHGVKITVAVPITKDNEEVLKELSAVADIKNTNDKARFVVVDGKSLMFMMLEENEVHPSYDAGIWVDTGFFAGAVEKMFDSRAREFIQESKLQLKNKN
jgi:sugar-specific transcriptional regulator TrmB